jgi:hypothetical protein
MRAGGESRRYVVFSAIQTKLWPQKGSEDAKMNKPFPLQFLRDLRLFAAIILSRATRRAAALHVDLALLDRLVRAADVGGDVP